MPYVSNTQALTAKPSSFFKWHARLGHPHQRVVSYIVKSHNLLISQSSNSSISTNCSSYHLGKLAKLPFASVEHTTTAPFQIIHSDVWGPAPILSHLGFSYFVLFVDDFTRFTWIYFLKNKSQVFHMFQEFQSLVSRQFNSQIKSFHSDWGGEYQKLNSYFKKQGIVHRIACPYTHEQNGISERKIRHVVDNGLTLLAHANVPLKFWSYAFQTSVQLINYMPSKVL